MVKSGAFFLSFGLGELKIEMRGSIEFGGVFESDGEEEKMETRFFLMTAGAEAAAAFPFVAC